MTFVAHQIVHWEQSKSHKVFSSFYVNVLFCQFLVILITNFSIFFFDSKLWHSWWWDSVWWDCEHLLKMSHTVIQDILTVQTIWKLFQCTYFCRVFNLIFIKMWNSSSVDWTAEEDILQSQLAQLSQLSVWWFNWSYITTPIFILLG